MGGATAGSRDRVLRRSAPSNVFAIAITFQPHTLNVCLLGFVQPLSCQALYAKGSASVLTNCDSFEQPQVILVDSDAKVI